MYEKRDENCHQQQLDDAAHGDDDEGEKVEGLACFVPLPLTTVFFFLWATSNTPVIHATLGRAQRLEVSAFQFLNSLPLSRALLFRSFR